jgi:hypothetical protein
MANAASGTFGESGIRDQSLRRRLEVHFGALAAACAATGLAAADTADAGVVYSGVVNINIPSTTAGVYLNVVTGVSNAAPASVPGWDLNPWSSTGLGLFNPAAPTGGVYVGTAAAGTQASNLSPGTLIGPASLFGSNSSATANSAVFNLNSSNNIVGFRFQNEANANAVHYGWMRVSLGAAHGVQPRAIVEYAYEDQAGVGILAGALPVSGVCCRGATCNTTVSQASCTGSGMAGASYVLSAPACNPGPVSSSPCCYADYNKTGGLSVQDIFDFLGDWFAGSPFANTGGNGNAGPLSVQNIFDFLSAWFTGGC